MDSNHPAVLRATLVVEDGSTRRTSHLRWRLMRLGYRLSDVLGWDIDSGRVLSLVFTACVTVLRSFDESRGIATWQNFTWRFVKTHLLAEFLRDDGLPVSIRNRVPLFEAQEYRREIPAGLLWEAEDWRRDEDPAEDIPAALDELEALDPRAGFTLRARSAGRILDDIGVELGCPGENVRRRELRARAKLLPILARRGCRLTFPDDGTLRFWWDRPLELRGQPD